MFELLNTQQLTPSEKNYETGDNCLNKNEFANIARKDVWVHREAHYNYDEIGHLVSS